MQCNAETKFQPPNRSILRVSGRYYSFFVGNRVCTLYMYAVFNHHIYECRDVCKLNIKCCPEKSWLGFF